MNYRPPLLTLLLVLSPFHANLAAADEVLIRQIVDQMLHEKNARIEQLESCVQQAAIGAKARRNNPDRDTPCAHNRTRHA